MSALRGDGDSGWGTMVMCGLACSEWVEWVDDGGGSGEFALWNQTQDMMDLFNETLEFDPQSRLQFFHEES